MAFIANEGVAPKGERYDRGALVKDAKNKNYKKTELGDFIYSSNNLETGSIGLNNYGNASISPVYSIFKPTGIADSDFIGRRFVRKDFINAMVKWRQGVVYGQWKIHESDFLKIEVAVPSLGEQRKIGSYLNNLDNLITLHQRKCEQTKELKKFMLQKMFPKKGEKNPEIRFPGFTDDWEQRKAGEIFKSVSDKGYTDLPVLSASQELGMILRDEIGIDIKYDESSIKNYKRVKPGQFVIHLRSFQGGFAWSDIEGITSPAYTILDYQEPEEHCSKFWKIVLTSPMFITRLETVTYGIRDGRSISFTDFSTLNLNVPSIAEQQKIGEYFSNLDNLITLHQRKCEKLKELKKYMLQNMFV